MTTVTYAPDPDQILAKASRLAADMQSHASPEKPSASRSLRIDTRPARRPATANEAPAESRYSPPRSLRIKGAAPRLGVTKTSPDEASPLPPRSPGLFRSVTARKDHGDREEANAGLFRTISNEVRSLNKSSDEPRPFEDQAARLQDDPIPVLNHDSLLTPSSYDSPSLPSTPRLRDSTFMPDHRKLKYAHPDSGKLKPRPQPTSAIESTRNFGQPTSAPISASAVSPRIPEATPEVTTFTLRDSVKSSTTYGSSTNDNSITTRTSTATSYTTNSDFPPSPQVAVFRPSLEEEMSVDDYISLYAQGFEDDPVTSINIPPVIANKPAVSSPLSPRRNEKVPPVPNITIPTAPKASLYETKRKDPAPETQAPVPARHVSTSSPAELSPTTPSSRRPSTSSTFTASSNLAPPQIPPLPTSNGRIASTDLFGGGIMLKNKTLENTEPSPDPNSDRYGFKKDNQYVSLLQYEMWDSQYRDYLDRRRQKWDDLMRQCSLGTLEPTEFPPRSDKVKRFIRKGIPPEWRGAAWFWYAGGPTVMARNKGLYQQLLMRTHNFSNLTESEREQIERDHEHIERDLYRTFPDNDKFKRLSNDPHATRPGSSASQAGVSANRTGSIDVVNAFERPMIGALRRVLRTFALHHPRIGYCQSLNFLAGQLLLFLDGNEEKAFHLLCILTAEHLPGTHGVALEGANVDISVLMGTLKDREPQLWAKLDDNALDDSSSSRSSRSKSQQLPTVSIATTSWFMSCFVGSLPVEACCRVWDVLFYEGSKTLFRVALGIFRLGADEIKRIRDPMEIFQVVQTLPRKMTDANALMEASFGKSLEGWGLLSQDTVTKRREERREFYATERREKETSIRGRSASAATQTTIASTSSPSESASIHGDEREERKRRPSLSRGASLKRLIRSKSRKRAPDVPPLPGPPK